MNINITQITIQDAWTSFTESWLPYFSISSLMFFSNSLRN